MSLSDAVNQHYKKNNASWLTAKRMYTGDFDPKQLLPRGAYEAKRIYEKRVQLADFHRHTALLIGRLSGSLMQREREVERSIGEVPESMLASIGPDGESYRQQLSKLADYLLLFNECWGWVKPAGGQAELHILDPLQVPRWMQEQTLMLGEMSTGNGIFEKEETQTTYTHHRAEGFTIYVEDEQTGRENKRVEVDSGVYSEDGAFFVDEDGNPHPPLFRIQMPWDNPFGLSVAESHQQLYKMRNELDMGSTAGLNSSIATITGVTDEEREQKIVHALKDGDQLLFMPEEAEMKSFELATGNIEAAEDRLNAKREDFYRTAYQSLEEASQSATESTITHSQGPAAALSTLAGVLESGEETILRFVEQAINLQDYGGPNPQQTNVSIEWPRDYQNIQLEG